MSRPAIAPRLSAIDGAQLAEEAHRICQEYVISLCVRVGAVSGSMGAGLLDEGHTLRHAVRTLAGYAQGLHELDAPPIEYAQTICEALWIRPIDGAAYETPDLDAALHGDLDELADDTRGRLVLVMVAALAREQLDRGHALTVAQLAALSSRSPNSLRRLAREGGLQLVERDGNLMATAAQSSKYLKSI